MRRKRPCPSCHPGGAVLSYLALRRSREGAGPNPCVHGCANDGGAQADAPCWRQTVPSTIDDSPPFAGGLGNPLRPAGTELDGASSNLVAACAGKYRAIPNTRTPEYPSSRLACPPVACGCAPSNGYAPRLVRATFLRVTEDGTMGRWRTSVPRAAGVSRALPLQSSRGAPKRRAAAVKNEGHAYDHRPDRRQPGTHP